MTGSPVQVRLAEESDLDAVLEVGHRTWHATYEPIAGADYVTIGLAKWWTPEAVLPAIRRGQTIVAERDGQVIGMAAFGPRAGDFVLWKLYVLPGHQRCGAGSMLIREALARADESGYDQVLLSVVDGNEPAAAFYRRHGFLEQSRESGGSGIPDSIWMARTLMAPPAPVEVGPDKEDR